MKRYFLQHTNRFFRWYCRNGLNVPCVILDALNEAEFCIRSPYDTDVEEYTVMDIHQVGEIDDSWYNIVVVLKAIDENGKANYSRHSFHMRFNNICLNGIRPQVKDLSFDWNHTYWGDTSWNEGSSEDDLNIAWDMLNAVNKYFNHINW